jgi:hypothetical protein
MEVTIQRLEDYLAGLFHDEIDPASGFQMQPLAYFPGNGDLSLAGERAGKDNCLCFPYLW